VVGSVPRNYGENLTAICSLTLSGIHTAMLLDGAVDGAAFEVYVEHILAPALTPGQVVIMDNLAVHKRRGVREVIEAAGAQVRFLPAYSPDLNPIEQAFAKLKAALRRAQARTREALEAAIAAAIETITTADAVAFFRDCGYHAPSLPL
jgi:transposase